MPRAHFVFGGASFESKPKKNTMFFFFSFEENIRKSPNAAEATHFVRFLSRLLRARSSLATPLGALGDSRFAASPSGESDESSLSSCTQSPVAIFWSKADVTLAAVNAVPSAFGFLRSPKSRSECLRPSFVFFRETFSFGLNLIWLTIFLELFTCLPVCTAAVNIFQCIARKKGIFHFFSPSLTYSNIPCISPETHSLRSWTVE